jgi:hypothetical protein
MVFSRFHVAAWLLTLASVVNAHGDDDHNGMDMKTPQAHQEHPGEEINNYDAPSYHGLGSHGNLMLAHIVLMVLAWFFILPIGISRPA